MNMNLKAIFFDFDGVLVESVDIKTRAFSKLFEREGEDVVKKVIDYHIDNGGVSRYEKFRYIYLITIEDSKQWKPSVFKQLDFLAATKSLCY